MSEYQYYEFLAIDRPLSEKEMGELRALSTRARITPASFVNEYNWGDFRGDCDRLMARYFDAFVYVANWGTRRFMLRLPRRLVDLEMLRRCCAGDAMDCSLSGTSVVLSFLSECDDGSWEDGEGWMQSLIPIRAAIASGDARSLYLGWLLCAQSDQAAMRSLEPPVPPGLGNLSASLKSLAKFLWIDEDLIAMAAEGSAPEEEGLTPSEQDLRRWIPTLAETEKDGLLARTVEGQGAIVRCEMLKRFREDHANDDEPTARKRRTVEQLLEAQQQRAERRERELEEQKRAARQRYLEDLADRADEVCGEVETLIRTKQPKTYDRAVKLLKELRDVAEHFGRTKPFEAQVRDLRRRHARKVTFIRRLTRAGLLAEEPRGSDDQK